MDYKEIEDINKSSIKNKDLKEEDIPLIEDYEELKEILLRLRERIKLDDDINILEELERLRCLTDEYRIPVNGFTHEKILEKILIVL